MENNEVSKYTVSFGLSLALACLLNAVVVVAKEKSPVVMAGLQRMTGHHWISHAAVVLVIFAALGWTLAQTNGGRGIGLTSNRLAGVVVGGILLGGLIIVGFYLTAG